MFSPTPLATDPPSCTACSCWWGNDSDLLTKGAAQALTKQTPAPAKPTPVPQTPAAKLGPGKCGGSRLLGPVANMNEEFLG